MKKAKNLKSLWSKKQRRELKEANNTTKAQMTYTPFTMKTRGMILTDRIRAQLLKEMPSDDIIIPGDRHDKMKKKLSSNAYLTIHNLAEMIGAYTFYDAYLGAIGHAKQPPMAMKLSEIQDWGRRKMKRYTTWAKMGHF